MGNKNEKQAFYKLSFWLSESQHKHLKKAAGTMSLSDYARHVFFKTGKKIKAAHLIDTASLLALLNKTDVHNAVNDIAHDIHCGTFISSQDTHQALLEVTHDIKILREQLTTNGAQKLNPNEAARILATLNKSRQHSNISQICEAIDNGLVLFSENIQTALFQALIDITTIRQQLMRATGKRA